MRRTALTPLHDDLLAAAGGTAACMTIEGATNTEIFHAYAREVLVPSLRPGDIFVMDHLGALIEQTGTQVRFLPTRPTLSPIGDGCGAI